MKKEEAVLIIRRKDKFLLNKIDGDHHAHRPVQKKQHDI